MYFQIREASRKGRPIEYNAVRACSKLEHQRANLYGKVIEVNQEGRVQVDLDRDSFFSVPDVTVKIVTGGLEEVRKGSDIGFTGLVTACRWLPTTGSLILNLELGSLK